jgi:hypothetical protein
MIPRPDVASPPVALYVTLVASLLVAVTLAAILFRSGSTLKPVRRTTFEFESPAATSAGAP